MARLYNETDYKIDFSSHTNLTEGEKNELNVIQESYRPMERIDYLLKFKDTDKITDDEWEKLTGLPFAL